MLRAGLHCGPAARLFFSLSELSTSLEQSMRRVLKNVQPLKRIVALRVTAIDSLYDIWKRPRASPLPMTACFLLWEPLPRKGMIVMTGSNLYLDLGLQEMPAHSAWTLEEHLSLSVGGKTDELVDIMSRLGRKKKCLQNKIIKMFPSGYTSKYTNTAFRKHGERHVIILPKHTLCY